MGEPGKEEESLGTQVARLLRMCDGHERGKHFIVRFLCFAGAAFVIEILAFLAVTVPNLSPDGIGALLDQLTLTLFLVVGGIFSLVPVVFGLPMAAGVKSKDSYCHMSFRGVRWGGFAAAILFGAHVYSP